MIRSLRDEALLLLDGKGAILEVAREVTHLLRQAGLHAPVIGGVAVVLHGFIRTTVDVDLFVPGELATVADALKQGGFQYRKARSEFVRDQIPVHLVTSRETRLIPAGFVEREGIDTISLPDLINLKLASGLSDPLRAIDLADVIGLIRVRRLDATFASKLAKELRPEFRKLARAVARDKNAH